jgi:hypothetical protein
VTISNETAGTGIVVSLTVERRRRRPRAGPNPILSPWQTAALERELAEKAASGWQSWQLTVLRRRLATLDPSGGAA